MPCSLLIPPSPFHCIVFLSEQEGQIQFLMLSTYDMDWQHAKIGIFQACELYRDGSRQLTFPRAIISAVLSFLEGLPQMTVSRCSVHFPGSSHLFHGYASCRWRADMLLNDPAPPHPHNHEPLICYWNDPVTRQLLPSSSSCIRSGRRICNGAC